MMICWLLRNQFLMYNIVFTRLSPVGSGAENEMHHERGSKE
jgi:hypothetical protein